MLGTVSIISAYPNLNLNGSKPKLFLSALLYLSGELIL
ncbi:MAG: hypothetical protein ACI8X3_001833, partial [Saprospiraceae bacterium]